MRTVLLVILILLLLGALPTWPYSSGWGYYPSGGLGLVLLIIVILALLAACKERSRFTNCYGWRVAPAVNLLARDLCLGCAAARKLSSLQIRRHLTFYS